MIESRPNMRLTKAEYCFSTLDQRKYLDSRVELVCLVIPELLQQDFLHHYHTSLEGGHEGIRRTYQRIRLTFTEEDLIEVSSVSWENALIARQETDNRSYAANLQEMFKSIIRFK